MDQLKSMLGFSGEIRIGTLAFEATKRGTAKNTDFVMVGDVWVFYRSDNPDTMDLSAFKTFSTTGSLVSAVRSYQEKGTVDVDFVDWSANVQLTARIAVRRITVS
jgi:hypothetical protein